jgi:predicted transcriptional regulator
MNAILSIKPKFAEAILSEEKKVEFRKTPIKKEVEKFFIYSTSPVKKITGYFTANEIIEDSPQNLWEQFGELGFIDRTAFFKYFENKDVGFSICIESINKFPTGIDPYEVIENFIPPQSFVYYNGIIESEKEAERGH